MTARERKLSRCPSCGHEAEPREFRHGALFSCPSCKKELVGEFRWTLLVFGILWAGTMVMAGHTVSPNNFSLMRWLPLASYLIFVVGMVHVITHKTKFRLPGSLEKCGMESALLLIGLMLAALSVAMLVFYDRLRFRMLLPWSHGGIR